MIIYVIICCICIYSLYVTRKDKISENYKYGIIILLVVELLAHLGSLKDSFKISVSDFANFIAYNIGFNWLSIIALILSIIILVKHNKEYNNKDNQIKEKNR